MCKANMDGNGMKWRGFVEIFRLAKSAYRRANGGTVAPGISDEVEPRYMPEELDRTTRSSRKEPWFSSAFARDSWISDDFRQFGIILACFLLLHVKFSVAQEPLAFRGAQPGGAQDLPRP